MAAWLYRTWTSPVGKFTEKGEQRPLKGRQVRFRMDPIVVTRRLMAKEFIVLSKLTQSFLSSSFPAATATTENVL